MEIEFAEHAGEGAVRGNENGKLPVTYADFERYGVHHDAVAPAVREAVALGFLEVTEVGRAGNAEYRTPSKYRLTYRHTKHAEPTHEWRRIKTPEEAASIAKAARVQKQRAAPGKRGTSLPKTRGETGELPPPETRGTVSPRKPGALSIYRIGDGAPAMWPPVLGAPSAWVVRLGRSQAVALAIAGEVGRPAA